MKLEKKTDLLPLIRNKHQFMVRSLPFPVYFLVVHFEENTKHERQHCMMRYQSKFCCSDMSFFQTVSKVAEVFLNIAVSLDEWIIPV